jgi:hypothetical protein
MKDIYKICFKFDHDNICHKYRSFVFNNIKNLIFKKLKCINFKKIIFIFIFLTYVLKLHVNNILCNEVVVYQNKSKTFPFIFQNTITYCIFQNTPRISIMNVFSLHILIRQNYITSHLFMKKMLV